MISNRYNPAFYALIVTDNDSEFDKAILNLVLYTIKKKNYNYISNHDGIIELCKSFESYIGFRMPYFKMENILNHAHKLGYLTYNNNNQYIPDFNRIAKCKINQNMYDSKTKFASLVKDFRAFCTNELEKELSNESAEKIIASFIEEQGISLFKQKNLYFNSNHDEYLFSKYLEKNYQNNSKILEYVNSLIVGRMYSELLFFDYSNSTNLNRLTVYIDSGFVFRLLGYESTNRSQIYKQLLDSLHEVGITTRIFKHTYLEIETIIANSIEWINNPQFDPARSTEAAYYFVTNNYTAEEVNNIVLQLNSILKNFEIEIDDPDFPQNIPSNVVSEKEYFESINNYYIENNPNFNKIEKETTVYTDAKSLFFVDYYNNGNGSQNISNIKSLLLTTNSSLSKVSHNIMIEKKHLSKKVIPFCVTDRLLSLMLWRLDKGTISEQSYNSLIVSINAALLPDDQTFSKFVESLDQALESNKLTPDECFLLKTNKIAHRYLMELTNGNLDVITDNTPLEILKQLQEDAKAIGRQEERNIANEQLAAKDDEIQRKDATIDSLKIKQIQAEISLCDSQRKSLEKDLQTVRQEHTDYQSFCQKCKSQSNFIKRAMYFICFLLIILAILLGFMLREDKWFNFWVFLVPLAPIALTYFVLMLRLKKPRIEDIVNTIGEKYYSWRIKKKGYDNGYEEQLKNKISSIEKDIQKAKDKSEQLMEEYSNY